MKQLRAFNARCVEAASTTGPRGNRYGDPAGHACIAVSGPFEAVITVETGSAAREDNMWLFARRAVELLDDCMRKAAS